MSSSFLITGPSGSSGDATSEKSIDEHITAVTTFTANRTVTWSIFNRPNATSADTDNIVSGITYDSEGDFYLDIKTQSESSILDVGGNTDGTKGLTIKKTYMYSDGSYSMIDIGSHQNGDDYRGSTSVVRSGWISEWNGSDPLAFEYFYIDSEGTTYVDNYYYIDGVGSNLPSNTIYDYGIDTHDNSKFSIDSETGELTFISAPDYENASDRDGYNDYVVTVRATDSEGNTTDQTLTVSVANAGDLDVSNHVVGTTYELENICDYDGYEHASRTSVADIVKSSYKYQGLIDVNANGRSEAIYTNKESGRWVTAKIDEVTGLIDYSDHGAGGTTRVVGIYIDPLVTSGDVVQGSDHDSQRRFQNDLLIDNLTAKASDDYDGDGFQEIYWKVNDNTAYLRSIMHLDGNIQYANYQNENQMSDYLLSRGYSTELVLSIMAASV